MNNGMMMGGGNFGGNFGGNMGNMGGNMMGGNFGGNMFGNNNMGGGNMHGGNMMGGKLGHQHQANNMAQILLEGMQRMSEQARMSKATEDLGTLNNTGFNYDRGSSGAG